MRFFFFVVILAAVFYLKDPFEIFGVFPVSFSNYPEQKNLIPRRFPINQFQAPVQRNLLSPITVKRNAVTYSLFAEFFVEAQVLSVKYYSMDAESEFSPVDLALGWQKMSSPRIFDDLRISQYDRFYHYRWDDTPPMTPSDIVKSSANMHIIPVNQQVYKEISKVGKQDIIRLSGFLTDIYGQNGWRWISSRHRNDQGAGACEVFYVEHAQIVK